MNEHETEMFRVDTMTDDLLQAVMALVQSGWLEDKRKLTPAVAMCYDMHDELVVQDGLLFLIIPKALPKPMLQALHSGHQGIESTFRLTRKTIYWPNMKSDVKHFTSRFETWATYGIRQQKETFISHDVPDHRWATIQQTSLGYTTRVYMVTVDYFSSFFEVDRLYDLIASTVIKKLKGHMAWYGIPDEVVSDCGWKYTSREFKAFTREYRFKHVTTSPYHRQSIDKAKSVVKEAQKILKNLQNPELVPTWLCWLIVTPYRKYFVPYKKKNKDKSPYF